jgi:hypothetical protein
MQRFERRVESKLIGNAWGGRPILSCSLVEGLVVNSETIWEQSSSLPFYCNKNQIMPSLTLLYFNQSSE